MVRARSYVGSLVAAALAAAAMPGRAQAVTIELKDVAPDRIERQRAAEEGALPLPGTPDLSSFKERLAEKGVRLGAPIFIRVFKAESELEIWARNGSGYVLVSTYPVCHWSGTIGPKVKEGDKQTPEGFYSVQRRQLHRSGRWPQALNLGFPNLFDRAQSRTGSYLLVHGGCSSIGCFAMTNTVIEEIFELTFAALKEGQGEVPVHVFPFRMTDQNLEAHKSSEWYGFWRNLKDGYDSFERTRRPPRVIVCERRYMVSDAPDEAVQQAGSRRAVRVATTAAAQACPGPDQTNGAPAEPAPEKPDQRAARSDKKPRVVSQAARNGNGAVSDPASTPGANVKTLFTEAR